MLVSIMARHEARVEHAPDMRSPGLSKPDAPEGMAADYTVCIKRISIQTVCGYINITAFAHSAGVPSPSPSIPDSSVQLPSKRNDGTGRTVGGLSLYWLGKRELPGRISKRSRSPENVPCLVAGGG